MISVPAALEGIVVNRPDPEQVKENLCADRGYDYPVTKRIVEAAGYVPHIKARGEEAAELQQIPGARARRHWLPSTAPPALVEHYSLTHALFLSHSRREQATGIVYP